MKPTDALDIHLRQYQWTATDIQDEVWRSFATSYVDSRAGNSYNSSLYQQAVRGDDELVERLGFTFAEIESDFLPKAQTVTVSADIIDVVTEAAKSMPEALLHADRVPFRDGLMVFEKPLDYFVPADVKEGTTFRIRALGWARQDVRSVIDDEVTETAGIVMICYTDANDVGDARERWGSKRWPDGFGAPPPLYPIDLTAWGFGVPWEIAPSEDEATDTAKSPHIAAFRKFLLALWTFMVDDIADTTDHRPDRATMKRVLRANPNATFPVITEVHFRRKLAEHGTTASGDPQQWSHSWIVSGHWRRIRNRETKQFEGRVTWVRPHVKGEGPLVVKERIITVDR